MKQFTLDQQTLDELVVLSKELNEQLKDFSNESDKIAAKWQLWAETNQTKVQKHKN